MALPNLPVTRRSLLLGAAGLVGGGALLAACGGSDDAPAGTADGDPNTGNPTGDTSAGDTAGDTPAGDFLVAPRFPNDKAFVPGPGAAARLAHPRRRRRCSSPAPIV